MAGTRVPYPFVHGVPDKTRRELERNFLYLQQQIGAASASVYDAIVDPNLAVSDAPSHLYVNFSELVSGEGVQTAGFNIGVRPGTINEPGSISLTGWSHINISAIGVAGTEGVVVSNAPVWNMPAVNMASGEIISMSGIRVPSASGTPFTTGFAGFAGSNVIMLNQCWIGSGINVSPGSLYATESLISSPVTEGSTSDIVSLHGCTWSGQSGAHALGGISTFHMLGGYLNGALDTTGNIPGGFYLAAAIQGEVTINHAEGGVINNLGSLNGTLFEIGSSVTGAIVVTGSWNEAWLRGRGIRADVRLTASDANPALKLVGVTDSLITADIVPAGTGAQAYTIDAASARNLIILGGTHNAFFTVASTNAGSTCAVIDELTVATLATVDHVRADMVPGELFAPQSGVQTLPAATGGSPSGTAGGSLTGTYPNPNLTSTITAAGPKGTASKVAAITYTAEGRLTAVTEIPISGAGIDSSALHSGDSAPPNGSAGGSLSGSFPNPQFAGRDSSVDKINQDLLPAALMDSAGVSGALATFPAPVGGVTVGDADYTASGFDRHIEYQTALTATRTVTLPFPNTMPQGTQLTIADTAGVINGGFAIKIAAATFSSINLITSPLINQKFGWITLESNGNTKWTIVGTSVLQEVDMNQAFLLMGG